MKIVILAAGIGSRLGHAYPKTLTRLSDGKTILEHLIKNITSYFPLNDIYLVVGFKKEIIMDLFPNLTFIYNEKFRVSNTAQSLLRGIEKLKNTDVLWINGDVVFDKRIIEKMVALGKNCMATNHCSVGSEEIKFSINGNGTIKNVSKKVKEPLGEALGINLIKKHDLPLLLEGLKKCQKKDYFEKGIEIAINQGLCIYPVEIGKHFCVEVDFKKDLDKVNNEIKKWHNDLV